MTLNNGCLSFRFQLSKSKTVFLPYRAETKTQPKLQSCKLQVATKFLSTACCRADFHQKRNPQPLLYIVFSVCVCATLWVGSFFLFFIILYIIYKYIYIYIIYIVYRDTKQKTQTNESCGLRFCSKSCHSIL